MNFIRHPQQITLIANGKFYLHCEMYTDKKKKEKTFNNHTGREQIQLII
jgi:hypothetical protein